MPVIKCKMCGGDIELSADKTFGTCEYCGSTMTLPKVSDDQRAAAFNRGNHFRRIGEFDKALAVYEHIVQEDDTDAEAHWCCALCRFGIEYVEDPATYEWLPTCHRASFDNFQEDVDYLAALEHSDGITRRQYQKEAAKIAEVQRGILATSQNEEPFDVFICYKESDDNGNRTRDSILAQDIYYRLTEQGRRVFFARITLEDKAGTEYEPYIFAALNSAKVMIALGTRPEYFNAVWVKNEWSRFLSLMKKDRSKLLLPCYRDMDPYDLPDQLGVLQSYDMSKIGFLQDLLHGVSKVLDGDKKPEPVKETVVVQQAGSSNAAALVDRGYMALEDGSWETADRFFEDALNLDAKNAIAYLGKALAQEQCRNQDELLRKRTELHQSAQAETLTMEPDTAHIEETIQKYCIPGYLDSFVIRNLYQFDLSYPSEVAAWKQQYQEEENWWNDNKILSRAEQFGNGPEIETLRKKKQALFAALKEKIRQAETADTEAREQLSAAYSAHIAQSDSETEQNYQTACTRKEEYYQELKKKADTEEDPYRLRNLASDFDRMGNYQDSQEMAENCLRKAKEVAEERDRQHELQKEQRKLQEKRERERRKKKVIFALVIVIVLIALIFAGIQLMRYNEKVKQYQTAQSLSENGQFAEAAILFGQLGDYKDSEQRSMECWINNVDVQKHTLSARKYAVGLKSDGTIVTAGLSSSSCDDVKDWSDIVEVSAGGDEHIVGLKADGTVVAVGENGNKQCNVSEWKNIISISAGSYYTVALKSDGTVVAVGKNLLGQRNVDDWTEIMAISSADHHTIGLKTDGTVVATGMDNYKQCNVSDWTDIVAVSAGNSHTVGLKSDGTVVATGSNAAGQCDVSDWTDIVAISAGYDHTIGLRKDGSVVATGSNKFGQCDVSGWSNIVAISAGNGNTLGLSSDGSVSALGYNNYGEWNVDGWTDIKLPGAN